MVRIRMHRLLGASLVALCLLGCGSAADLVCATTECVSDRFFGAEASSQPDCEGAVRSELGVSIDVEVLYSDSLAVDEVARLTRSAASYYAEYRSSFRLLEAPQALELGPLIAGSRSEIDRALIDAGLPVEGELDAEQTALMDAIVAKLLLAPLREFIHEHAVPRRPLVSLVVLERLTAPSLYEEGLLSAKVDGLGLSPEFVSRLRDSDDATDLFDALELPAEFTPTLFLDVEALGRFEHPANVVAHELGHALGLLHTDEPGNLMNPEVAESCRAWLSKAQTTSIVETVEAR
jgi:hypothetical protein